ncbi:hypothetical protein GHT07_15065 [Caenimonas koreensis DSM 17982]|uniref:Uncharacterized protein n=1 Tax=Caenimonas koreensis DSM 17982 TaxID=1121255 RepID=A0A844BAX9_9BURK|nr:hypothetical protein [Caenimonas koreensis]MRD48607.1 hypothetical protein [Caenimonas koreensis DSM 17982]
MDKIIVYIDDAEHALQQLAPMHEQRAGAAPDPTHWVIVACAPRMTRRISKWTSYSAREAWRDRWADKLFALMAPVLRRGGDRVTTQLAHGPLKDLTQRLLTEHGVCRVLDARRPKFGQELEAVVQSQPSAPGAKWEVPGAVASMGAMLILAAD